MVMDVETETPNGGGQKDTIPPAPATDVDEDVDQLDAFMAGLEQI
jgi:hypothetical protein